MQKRKPLNHFIFLMLNFSVVLVLSSFFLGINGVSGAPILSSENDVKKMHSEKDNMEIKILFLHHSTGQRIWQGGIPEWFANYNAEHGTKYQIVESVFPKAQPYGWKNYPFDYWNIWVKNAGAEPYLKELTLEILSEKYDVISWKHCYPVSRIQEKSDTPDVESEVKTLGNYKLQYLALKSKMHEFPNTKFIVWTGAALVEPNTNKKEGARARSFFDWVKKEWDEPGDNIFIWDFFELETAGGLYLKPEYADKPTNSHPNDTFSHQVAPYFAQRVVDVIEGRGDSSPLTGKYE